MVTYLVDTSVWAGFFRNRGTPANQQLDALIDADSRQIRGCPPVRMELAVDQDDLRRRRLLRTYDGFLSAGIVSDDFDLAAEVYRMAQRRGHTIRSQLDCVIAAIALRAEATLVHNDVDFDRIAEVIPDLAVLRLPDR
jgi:predicted nucleic acid-binding protein